MAAFGLGKLPFFSSRNHDDLKDAAPDGPPPAAAGKPVPRSQEPGDEGQGRQGGAVLQKIGKRENQIDGQAIRRPALEASALTGGFLSFAGIRDHYIASEPKRGSFVIRHIDSGRETTISGVDYIQFSDLTVSSEYLTRSNAETLPLPTPANAPGSPGNILELTQEVAAAFDKGLLSLAEEKSEDALSVKEASLEAANDGNAIQDEPAAKAGSAAESSSHGAIIITEAELLAGAGDDAEDSLKISDISCAQDGNIENNGDGSWTFQPEGDFSGEIILQLTIVDGAGEESSVDAIITIEAEDGDSEAAEAAPGETAAELAAGEIETEIKDAEVASEDGSSIAKSPEPVPAESEDEQVDAAESKEKSLTIKVSELIGSGDETEGKGLRLYEFAQPSNGRLVDNGDNTLSFTPDPDWNRSMTFEYTMIDDAGRTTIGTTIVELDPVETDPSEPQPAPAPQADTVANVSPETAADIPVDHAELYAGQRYEDVEVDDEDQLIGEPIIESSSGADDANGKTTSEGPTYADAWAGSLGSGEVRAQQPPGAVGHKSGKKPSANAEAAAELFKKLDW
jgi:hypothetical protein